ncbi:malonate decarboxylase subunit [Stenotrophomonas indicatrix]|uniref:AEC family transporter n=1 Tax=Stenotrophomonas indicatrix TaxID=2045451 RepID=UPI000C18A724|nr:AEC family transporter [Stenotrophomonas indicatrix]PII15846.1 malonate decarboxylase subunit [Stenotrophomonas indicatrix]
MITIISMALVPIYFVLLLGYTAGKFGVINNTHVGELNTVVMSYALPASLFAATAATPRTDLLSQWPLLVILGCAMMVVYPLWYLLQRKVLGQPSSEAALQSLTVALPNYAAAGLPIVVALLGPTHTVPVALAIAAGSLLPSPVTLALLELAAPKKSGSGEQGSRVRRSLQAVGHALLKPIVLAPIAGTLIAMLGWKLPTVASVSLTQIGQAAGGMALFVTGLILSAQRFRLTWNTAIATITVTVAQPLLALGIARMIGAPDDITRIAVLMAALPSGFFGILFGVNAGVASEESGSMVIASTLASVVTLAVTIGWLYSPGATP